MFVDIDFEFRSSLWGSFIGNKGHSNVYNESLDIFIHAWSTYEMTQFVYTVLSSMSIETLAHQKVQ